MSEKKNMNNRKIAGIDFHSILKNRGFIIAIMLVAVAMVIPVGGDENINENMTNKIEVDEMNLTTFSSEHPDTNLHLLFIHHSIGGQLMADSGREKGECCIYETSSNGGGLRTMLQKEGYIVHEASYESEVGEKTDTFDWPPKFKIDMDKVLRVDQQDNYLKDGTENNIVVFKSCYPNNGFGGVGEEPGNPLGPKLTVANAKAAYTSLLSEFAKQPETLFVAMTTPPLIGKLHPEPMWKFLARKILRRPLQRPSTEGPLAREFANWLKSKDGWLSNYKLKNVVVFDYYDILTDNGKSNYLEFPSGGGNNAHPNNIGNAKAAREFVPFINKAVRRAGLI